MLLRDGDLDLAEGLPDGRQQFFNRLPVPFCCDDYAGIKD